MYKCVNQLRAMNMKLQFAICAYIFFSVRNIEAKLVNETLIPLKRIIDDVTTTPKPAIVKEYEKKVCANEPTCHLVDQMPNYDQTFPRRDCMCDADCVTYGDCCRDSKFYNQTEQSRNHFLYYCSEPNSIYIKNRCSTNFTDVDIIEKCQMTNATFRSVDTHLVAFVTDTKTRTTYANKYCARCDNIDDYVVWNVTYYCFTSTPRFDDQKINDEESKHHKKIPQLIKLNGTDNSFYAEYNGGKYECGQSIIQPSKLQSVNLRQCVTASISCPATYSGDEETIAKCHSYTSIVYDQVTLKSYRNKECAKCNGIPEANVRGCFPILKRTPEIAFSEVFRTDDKAGGSNACSSDTNAAVKEKFCR